MSAAVRASHGHDGLGRARPRGAAAFVLALLLPLALLPLLHAASRPALASADARLMRLTAATRHAAPPSSAADGVPVELPYLALRGRYGADAAPTWFVVPFELAADADEPFALRAEFRPSLVLYLDGQLLVRTAPPELLDRTDRHFQLGNRALRVEIPPTLLRAGGHEFVVRVGAGGYDGAALSALQVGPVDALARLDAARTAVHWLRAIVAGGAGALGAFLVIAWALVRREWIYGLAGVNCLLIALLLAPALLAEAPLAPVAWRALLDGADVAAKALTLALVLRLAGPPVARFVPWVAGYATVALAVDVTAALQLRPWTDFSHWWPWWALGSRAAVLAIATLVAAWAAARHGGLRAVLAASAVGLAAWSWAYVSGAVLIARGAETVDLNFVGHGAWVLVIAVLLQRRYVQSLRREQTARADLERQVRERTAELERQHAALRATESRLQAQAERERLLREMHDGLGSRLVAAKIAAQRTTLAPDEVVRVFDDCLQEMRLTVDSLSVEDGDLGLLLASFRHRVGPRLASAGLALEWQVRDAPRVPALASGGGRELVRVLEELLGNVLQHAGATRARIATGAEDNAVVLTVTDDGRGIGADAGEGRGLGNVRARVAGLGGGVEWRAAPGGGTEVRIRLGLD